LPNSKKLEKDIENKLAKLKGSVDLDFDKIRKDLTVINDTESSYILEKISAFENANSERITLWENYVCNVPSMRRPI
jgi:hypothetical protein